MTSFLCLELKSKKTIYCVIIWLKDAVYTKVLAAFADQSGLVIVWNTAREAFGLHNVHSTFWL